MDSVADADADDVLLALIDILFRQNSIRSWLFFSGGLLISFSLTVAFWLNDQFLGGAACSATAMAIVICRIVGLSQDKQAKGREQPEEIEAQA